MRCACGYTGPSGLHVQRVSRGLERLTGQCGLGVERDGALVPADHHRARDRRGIAHRRRVAGDGGRGARQYRNDAVAPPARQIEGGELLVVAFGGGAHGAKAEGHIVRRQPVLSLGRRGRIRGGGDRAGARQREAGVHPGELEVSGPVLAVRVHGGGNTGGLHRSQGALARGAGARQRKGLHLGDAEQADADDDHGDHDFHQAETVGATGRAARVHGQFTASATCVRVLAVPTAVSSRQRFHALLLVDSVRVKVVGSCAVAVANPSRLYFTAVTLAAMASGTVPENACCTCSSLSPLFSWRSLFVSEKTIQPWFQPVLVHAAPLEEAQTTTNWPSLMASARANCISPRSELTSADIR